MKNIVRMLSLAAILLFPKWAFADVYGEVGLGVAGGKVAAPTFQMKAIKSTAKHEFSLGYFNVYGAEADGMRSDGADLPTVALEVYRVWKLPNGDGSLSYGGGIGYTMPNLAGGVNEQADNDLSWTAGANLVRPLSKRYDISFGVKGFFFKTDSHLTTYGSHMEPIYVNGAESGQAEVLDEFHQDNTLNFNSVLFSVSLRWK